MIKKQFTQNKASWIKSSLDGISQDENGNHLPWMTYPAIDFLQKNINKNHQIFEFGCGSSTLFFAKKAKQVIGLETNKKWLEITKKMLIDSHSNNVEIFLMEDGLENDSYENFAKNSGEKFDFIIIDSIKRFECVKNSILALKKDGVIILDDSERKNYQKIFDFLESKGFKTRDFLGIAPGQIRLKNTTLFFSA